MIEDIIENIEDAIEYIKSIKDAPADEQNDMLAQLREISDKLNEWAEDGIGEDSDDEDEIDEDDM